MYSLRYGTVPIVHRTGGLADTVSNFDTTRGTGNGFSFENFDQGGLSWALTRAISILGLGSGRGPRALDPSPEERHARALLRGTNASPRTRPSTR